MKKVISVRFINNSNTSYSSASRKAYDYFYDGDIDVDKDDIAVVASPYQSICATIIVGVRDAISTDRLKTVIGVVSRAAEREEAERAKRKVALKKKIDKLITKYNDTLVLKAIAETVPGAAELIKELEELG